MKLNKKDLIINSILFNDCLINNSFINFKNIDLNEFVKYTSSQLLLPTIYNKLKINKLLKKIPIDFSEYLKYINKCNLNRNRLIIKESKSIGDIFKKNKIDHVFIKGAAILANKKSNDEISERMTGDIDILISKCDYLNSIKICKSMGYFEIKNSFFRKRHYPRLFHKNKNIALEIHHKTMEFNSDYLDNKLLNDKIDSHLGINIPDKYCELLNNIYNYQINDKGQQLAKFSFKNIYDTFLNLNELKAKKNRLLKDKVCRKYLIILNELNILESRFELSFNEKIFKERFKLKYKYRFIQFFDNYLNYCVDYFWQTILIVKELIENKKYRNYFFSLYRIKSKFNL